MSLCKYCEKVEIQWPENYVSGMKPLEIETGIEHNMERCKDLQNSNVIKNTEGWIRRVCSKCKNLGLYHRKHFTEKTVPDPCRECIFLFNSF